jgi:hypothetical protein
MNRSNSLAALIAASLIAASLSGCNAEPAATVEKMPPAPPPTAVGKASGKGTLEFVEFGDPSQPPKRSNVEFSPTFAYAWPAMSEGHRTLWIVVTDQAPDTAALDRTEDRQQAWHKACADKHVRYTALQLDDKGAPIASERCAGDGSPSNARLGPDMVMGDRGSVKLDVNDGKHVKGGMAIGVGMQRVGEVESFAETTGEYTFDVDVAPPNLRDRVLADGDEKASGVPGAKAALVKYFAAAGASKSLADVAPWLTPERRATAEAQDAEAKAIAPKFAERTWQMFVSAHASPPTFTGAKAIGAAAVISSQIRSGDRLLDCQTLMLQIDGAWKVGDEDCATKEPKA